MTVIAMTKEMGSLDKELAEAIAKELGLTTVYDQIIDHLTAEMRLSREAVTRVVEGRAGRLDLWKTDARALHAHTCQKLFDLAQQDNVVIRGWAAPYLFRPVPHIPCIRICAPLQQRMRNLMKILGSDDQHAILKQIRRSDLAYAATLRLSARSNSIDASHFHLVLDTERHSVEHCAGEIARLATSREFQATAASLAQLKQMALQTRVRAALRKSPQAAKARLAIVGDDDVIRLEGMVKNRQQLAAIEQVVAGVPGVEKIDNRLRPISGTHRTFRIISSV